MNLPRDREPTPEEQAAFDEYIAKTKAELKQKDLDRLADIKGGYGKRDGGTKTLGSRVMRRGANLRDA